MPLPDEDELPADDPVTHTVDAGHAADDAGPGLPDQLPGLDISETLAALHIDAATLTQILNGFLIDNRETVRRMQSALADGDRSQLGQLAHSLKGSAANIGAARLSETAHALEATGSQSPPQSVDRLAALIDAVDDAMAPVLQSIEGLAATAKNAAPADAAPMDADGDAPDFATLLERLAEAIDRADPEPIMALMPAIRNRAAGSAAIDPSLVEALARQVDRYDYDQALETLSRIRNASQGNP